MEGTTCPLQFKKISINHHPFHLSSYHNYPHPHQTLPFAPRGSGFTWFYRNTISTYHSKAVLYLRAAALSHFDLAEPAKSKRIKPNMADSSNGSSSSGGDCGGVRLSDHSPSATASYLYQTTPSSSASTIRGSNHSPADVFGPDLPSRAPRLHARGHQQDYQLPQPPRFHPGYKFVVPGSSQQAGPPNAQYTSNSSAGRASVHSGGAVVATPTNRSLIETTSAGNRSGNVVSTPSRGFKSDPSNVKTPVPTTSSANISSTINSDTRRAQPGLQTISEEQNKSLESYGSAQPNKIAIGMSAHCQLEGPLAGPLRDSRRSELARGHVSHLNSLSPLAPSTFMSEYTELPLACIVLPMPFRCSLVFSLRILN